MAVSGALTSSTSLTHPQYTNHATSTRPTRRLPSPLILQKGKLRLGGGQLQCLHLPQLPHILSGARQLGPDLILSILPCWSNGDSKRNKHLCKQRQHMLRTGGGRSRSFPRAHALNSTPQAWAQGPAPHGCPINVWEQDWRSRDQDLDCSTLFTTQTQKTRDTWLSVG